MTGRFLTLLLVTVMTGVAAVVVLQSDRGELSAGDAGRPLFPGLIDRVNDVTTLSVTTVDGSLTLRSHDGSWTVDELGGYAADFDVVKGLVVGLAELELVEPKTRRSDRYAKLGVEDPTTAEPGSLALRLVLSSGATALADVILGNASPGQPPGLYVRKAKDDQSWLARGELKPPRQPVECVDAQLFDLPLDRLARLRVEHADGEVVSVVRDGPAETTWSLRDLPKGREPAYAGVGRTVAAFPTRLSFESVLRAEDAPLPEPVSHATFTAFDGLRLDIDFARVEDRVRAVFRFDTDESMVADAEPPAGEGDEDNTVDGSLSAVSEEVRAEVRELNARLSPWVFVLPDWKSDNLTMRLDALTKASEPPPEPEPPSEPPSPDDQG